MKNKISKAAAALAIAAATVFAAPAVASAQTAERYTPAPANGTSVTIVAGENATVVFNNFVANENVVFTLTGFNASAGSLAAVNAAADESISIEKEANADGEAAVEVTLPDNAQGDYTLSADGEVSGESADVTISVAATGDGSGVLPGSGFDGDALLGLWVGGGVLVLAGASIAVATSVRRARQTA
ncbi:hypothetical protein AB3M83_12825 [Microbacterium sp. 179-B 1A2 NHS]|uniref:hypothetical protein n=1 Tax=Microbacterium sp. 179-B 1A2 NHS TaxID=3142383 RepID=UPI0039A01201